MTFEWEAGGRGNRHGAGCAVAVGWRREMPTEVKIGEEAYRVGKVKVKVMVKVLFTGEGLAVSAGDSGGRGRFTWCERENR